MTDVRSSNQICAWEQIAEERLRQIDQLQREAQEARDELERRRAEFLAAVDAKAPPAGWLLQGWQPISGAPRNGSHILVMDIDDPTITTVVAWGNGEWKFVTDHGRISHWMPLPPHPRLVNGLERLALPENSAAVYVQSDGTVTSCPAEKASDG